jgi:hypothetical protein
LVSSFESNSLIIDDYFSSMIVDYKSSKKVFDAVLEVNVQNTVDKLLGSGINANFEQPLLKIIKDNVASGSDRIEIIKTLKDQLAGGKLSKYSSQVGSDAITQFNSNYLNAVSADLKLKHYFYKGTKVDDSRDFCRRLAGKYFTEDQLKKIVEQESNKNNGKGWGGMIPGTNWTNFPTYRGGYRCRHYLIPVSKLIYDRFK